MTHWPEFDQQNRWIEEGAQAGLAGKMRQDCPYDQVAQSSAWNMWVYGFHNARGEIAHLASGTMTFISVSKDMKTITSEQTMTTREAFERGMWKPEYVQVPSDWKRPADAD